MSLQNFLNSLDELVGEARATLSSVDSSDALEALRVKFVGAKNGALKSVQKLLGAVEVPDKPAAGKRFNEVRDAIQSLLDEATARIGGGAVTKSESLPDATLPGLRPRLGQLHPITQTIEHLKEIMGPLGIHSVTEGPRGRGHVAQLRRIQHSRKITQRETRSITFTWLSASKSAATGSSSAGRR
jgi:phenylalanyl-tRNA synthetase alpha chain